MAGSAGSHAQRHARHLRKHPNDLQARKTKDTPRKAPKSEKWTRQTKDLAVLAVKSGYAGDAVLKYWPYGIIWGGKRHMNDKNRDVWNRHRKEVDDQLRKDDERKQAMRAAAKKSGEEKSAKPSGDKKPGKKPASK